MIYLSNLKKTLIFPHSCANMLNSFSVVRGEANFP
jgi:hypothetical protein